MGYCAGKPIEKRNIFCFYLKLFYKSNKPQFLCYYLWVARDLQALLVFCQHPAWYITSVNPQKLRFIAK